ncbi:unnamed protein product, partial [marine sediment metagenome]
GLNSPFGCRVTGWHFTGLGMWTFGILMGQSGA